MAHGGCDQATTACVTERSVRGGPSRDTPGLHETSEYGRVSKVQHAKRLAWLTARQCIGYAVFRTTRPQVAELSSTPGSHECEQGAVQAGACAELTEEQ